MPWNLVLMGVLIIALVGTYAYRGRIGAAPAVVIGMLLAVVVALILGNHV